MVISRALREAADANRSAVSHGEFAAMLLAALEDPAIRQAVAEAAMPRKSQRQPAPPVTTIAAARDLKAARLAAGRRGRG